MKFDIATVTFEKEYPMIEIQARSIAKHIKLDIGKILIINNSDSFLDINKNWYGKFSENVQLIHVDELVSNTHIASYCKQQISKIKIHKQAISDTIILLDNKNWFINDVTVDKVLKNNLIPGESGGYGNCWHSAWQHSFDYFGVNLENGIDSVYSSATPFFVKKDTLTELSDLADIEHLIAFEHCTEFALITAFIVKKFGNLKNYFFECNNLVTGTWPGARSRIKNAVNHMYRDTPHLCSGCHRNFWKLLSNHEKNCLAIRWEQQGLVDQAKGIDIINNMIDLNS